MNDEIDNDAMSGCSALQFEKVEGCGLESESLDCAFCDTRIHNHYFEVNGRTACERCFLEHKRMPFKGSGTSRFFRAIMAGTAAGAIGAILWYAVTALTGYEIGLIAIVVGLMVGFAVRWGSRGRGGWAYQTLAVVLTYFAIVSTYVPQIIDELRTMQPVMEEAAVAYPGSESGNAEGDAATVAAEPAEASFAGLLMSLASIMLLAAALPFLAGFDNIIGILIIAFGLYEAWKVNQPTTLEIKGPYKIGLTEVDAGELSVD